MSHARRTLLSPYHFLWALGSALWYGFPARRLTVVGVTGTKGKSSVSEMLFATFSEAGHKTALAGTIRFAYGETSRPNLFKMTLPGRGFIQKFLADAVKEGCTHAVIEITSEAALQHRHRFLALDALIFTNLQKEHLESHGSMERYFQAKYAIACELARSSKRPRAIVANADDAYGTRFLDTPVERMIPFSFTDAADAHIDERRVSFSYGKTAFDIPQPGRFSVMNALAAIKTAEFLSIPLAKARDALAALTVIRGRAERVEEGQDFAVIVDYAHTTDSLKALYGAFPQRKICVLGNTGGGRDRWKRPEMGRIAEAACAQVFLTNEDPYDEDPHKILDEMAAGMEKKKPDIVMDRREAIRAALAAAHAGDAVLITGKGTDPYIMEANGKKTPWSDAQVAREELQRLKEGRG